MEINGKRQWRAYSITSDPDHPEGVVSISVEHLAYTNVIGKDKDVGYEIFRVDPRQKWNPAYLLQPIGNLVLMAAFEWGVALHDLDFDKIKSGEKSQKQVRDELKGIGRNGAPQILRDYIAYPALSGRSGFESTAKANFTANLIRNVWSNAIIFCGHFPDQTFMFTEAEVKDESRGAASRARNPVPTWPRPRPTSPTARPCPRSRRPRGGPP